MVSLHRTLVYGTMVLVVLTVVLQVRLVYASAQPPIVPNVPIVPQGFVKVTGPRGITVLVGPLLVSPTGGYEREVIVPGRPPFYVNTEPGVTPQQIANIYG